MDKTVNIVELYDRIFIEVDGSYTTDHKVPYITFPDGDIDHFYVNTIDFFGELLNVKISSVTHKKDINKLVVRITSSVSVATLKQLPENYIIYAEEHLICIQIPL